MPAQHVTKAAAVLLAASALTMPTVDLTATSDLNSDSFIEVLIAPGDSSNRTANLASINYGCNPHHPEF